MSPVVTSPQVAVGAVGRMRRLPRFVANENNDRDDKWVGGDDGDYSYDYYDNDYGVHERRRRRERTRLRVMEAHVAHVSWGADHRAVDGATLARFGNLWKFYVENPISMTLVLSPPAPLLTR